MDVLSHALWGYAVLRCRGPRMARWGALIGAAPDLLFFGASLAERVVVHGWDHGLQGPGRDPAMWRRDGPPLTPDLVASYENYYVYTHSLVILAIIGLAWFLLRRRIPWLLLPWAVHILMDIPTHERYLTPFLFPLSRWTVEGYAWSRPPLLWANWSALILVYAFLIWRYWRGREIDPGPAQPEEAAA